MYDTTLLQALKQKDIKAFPLLYDKYSPVLYNCILKITDNASVACTILEKSFCTIWNTVHQYNPSQQTLFNWMLQTTINQCRETLEIEKGEIVRRMSHHQRSEVQMV